MLHRRVNFGLVVLVGTLSACTPTERQAATTNILQDISVASVYRPPNPAVTDQVAAVSRASSKEVIGRAVSLLENRGMIVTVTAGEKGDLIVATYTGDPSPYLDCGAWLVRSEDGSTHETAAASRISDYVIKVENQSYRVSSELMLDARLLLEVIGREPRSTVTTAEAHYVVTSVSKALRAGQVVATKGEIIDFESGEVGVFETGKRCGPTGDLEQVVSLL